ncbi:MAG: tRNA (adenosine(37)-N6)-dimethylallyltransferase MiaA [Bacteroides sp.]|nr:tRNA (adenosine(37)-N6)-dimethylallyltransferase MiaA [Bacteroides sp.]
MNKAECIVITGPTASGKTRFAVELARKVGGEIISADSRQVYRGMDLGTGKDLSEYGEVPYHLIDVAPAGSKFNLHQYLNLFREAYDDILRRGKVPVICGGTGMYLEQALNGVTLPEVPENTSLRRSLEGKSLEELAAILRTYKELHNTTDIDTAKRAIRAIEIEDYYQRNPEEGALSHKKGANPLDALVVLVDIPREERRRRISDRLEGRINAGMIDEVRRLLDSGIQAEDLIYYGLEYKFLTRHVIGELSYGEMLHELEIAIHQFAKRQMTWFRGMERRGFRLHPVSCSLSPAAFADEVIRLWSEQL